VAPACEAGPAPEQRAWIGLGANLGEPRQALAAALAALARLPGTRLAAVSSLYRSAPVDADGPDFLNAVAALDTHLSATTLLAALQRLEAEAGRTRPYRNAPRLLDLDLLLHGGQRIDSPTLTLPHPRMHLRAFVLAPLAELDPGLVLPGRGPVGALLQALNGQRIERLAEGLVMPEGNPGHDDDPVPAAHQHPDR